MSGEIMERIPGMNCPNCRKEYVSGRANITLWILIQSRGVRRRKAQFLCPSCLREVMEEVTEQRADELADYGVEALTAYFGHEGLSDSPSGVDGLLDAFQVIIGPDDGFDLELQALLAIS